MEDRPGSTWRREIKKWKKRENLEEDWNRLIAKDIARKVSRGEWRERMERKSTLKWYARKEKPEKLG